MSARLRILVADDYADSRDMLAFLLEHLGYSVVVAEDGPSAIAAAVDFAPHVAILDIGMPGISGYGVAEELRRRAGHPLTLFALSGLGEPADKARAAAAGFDRYFTKPVDLTLLTDVLATLRGD
jgi:CheY-like chemotaxis protein